MGPQPGDIAAGPCKVCWASRPRNRVLAMLCGMALEEQDCWAEWPGKEPHACSAWAQTSQDGGDTGWGLLLCF